MTVSPTTGALDASDAVTAARIAVAVMKKAQDSRKAEGQAMVQLIEQALPDHIGRLVNTRA